ncbi:MAG TPA: hypothetical protein VLE19_16830 [Pyrinomonadaceae bacterium]|nr:hypothetical protein [Pyrinomonadaceae bacterium]
MKRMHLVAVAGLTLLTLIIDSQSPGQRARTTPSVPTTQSLTIERQVSTQQRINRYFHGDVVSRLKSCWSNVQSKGRIAFKYIYTKVDSQWMFSRVETEQSTLPGRQAKVALRCMSEAVRGTSFPSDGAESQQNTYVVTWTWPVPFPTNAAQLTSAMFAAKPTGGSNTGGCDGRGAPAKCLICTPANGTATCERVCVGYKQCTLSSSTDTCRLQDACASGGPFGVGGGTIIY